MKNLFPGYYRPSDEEFVRLWAECTFVLDTNVLLNLYRYPQSARDDLLTILEKIAGRLWIPHQVALEYQRNRLTVIGEQMSRYSEVENTLNSTYSDLKKALENLQLKKRHSAIDPDQLLKQVDGIFQTFSSDLKRLKQDQPDVHNTDDLRHQLEELLVGKIGNCPSSQEDLDGLYEEGTKRFEKNCPPGYMDRNKGDDGEDGFIHNGMKFQRKFGDYVMWTQILAYAREEKLKQVVLVIDDTKEDWWWSVKGKTIGPRPQLVEEIMAQADVESFYMYSSENFMRYAKEYLSLEVKEESIEQVRDVARIGKSSSSRIPDFIRQRETAELSVFKWLNQTNPNSDIIKHEFGFIDIELTTIGGKYGYVIQPISNERSLFRRLREAMYRAYYEVQENDFEKVNLVYVIDEHAEFDYTNIEQTVWSMVDNWPNGIIVIIGVMDQEKVFRPELFSDARG